MGPGLELIGKAPSYDSSYLEPKAVLRKQFQTTKNRVEKLQNHITNISKTGKVVKNKLKGR